MTPGPAVFRPMSFPVSIIVEMLGVKPVVAVSGLVAVTDVTKVVLLMSAAAT
jgi:hypothetical protein